LETLMNAIIEKLEKSREQITGRLEALQKRQREIINQGEKAVSEGKDRMRVIEATALTQALELVAMTNDKLEDRSAILKRGEEALGDLLVTVRAGQESTLPIEDFDGLSIKKLRPYIEELDAINLRAVRVYESANKNRITLLREIDAQLEDLAA
jgi:seryl-tRNA synthetase